jgi:hypothetical protein
MRPLAAAALGAAVSAATLVAAGALAGGGPPPTDPPAPDVRTVVTHGTAAVEVIAPAHRSNRTIERAVRRARSAAMPRALTAARAEARSIAAPAGMRLAGPIGVSRDASPFGYYDEDSGRFGPGRWCGRIVTSHYRDGRRITRSHHGCPIPRYMTVRLTVTFAAR